MLLSFRKLYSKIYCIIVGRCDIVIIGKKKILRLFGELYSKVYCITVDTYDIVILGREKRLPSLLKTH